MTFNPLRGTVVITGSNNVVLLKRGSGIIDATQATNTAVCKLAPGNDRILLGPGNDGIYSYGGNNHITFPAASVTDTFIAVRGNNVIIDGGGSSFISLGSGNSQLTLAGSGRSFATSGNGNNRIKITGGSVSLALGNGNNHITIGRGENDDDDTSNTTNTATNNDVTVGNGHNTVTIQGGSNNVNAGGGNNEITIRGGGSNRVVVGNGNNDVATGSGNDVIVVGNGNNEVDAGGGSDYCYYGTGRDEITNCQHQQMISATSTALDCLPPSIAASAATTCTATLSGYTGTVAGQTMAFSQVGVGEVLPDSTVCSLSPVGVCSVSLTGQFAGDVTVEALYAGDSQNGASLATSSVTVAGTPDLVQPVVQWFPQSTTTFVAREGLPLGETFVSSQSFQNADLVVSGPVSDLISGLQGSFPSISANQGQSVGGSVTIPLNTPSGWYNGSLSVQVAGQSVPGVLRLNIFVPKMQTVQAKTPTGSATYAITKSFSPFFSNTYDVTEYLFFPNGTAFPFRTLYDTRNNTGALAPAAPSVFLPAAPSMATDQTHYFFTYHFQDTLAANHANDLGNASKALRSTPGNPLIIRNDISWKSVDQGYLKCLLSTPHARCLREAWVHTQWDFSAVDKAFGVANSARAKFLPILATHSPPVGLNQWSFSAEANYFIGNVTKYIESKYSGMVAGWQVSDEPNNIEPDGVCLPILGRTCFIDWSAEASSLASYVEKVKANDPTHQSVAVTMYVANPDVLSVVGLFNDPWQNIFMADRIASTQLGTSLDIMGVDIYPDQWLPTLFSPHLTNTARFGLAIQQTLDDRTTAKQVAGFNGMWGVYEMPPGPRFLGIQQIVQPQEVGQWINISKAANPPPAMIGLFQVRGCGIEGLLENPPADGSAECAIDILPPFLGGTYGNRSYGLIDYDNGAVRLDYLNAIRSAVAVSQPIALSASPLGSSPITWTISGCEASPSSITGDGSMQFISADPLCTMTISYANSGSTRYVMGNAAPSLSVTTCDVGICPVSTSTYYYQDRVTASYSVSGGGSPVAPTLRGTQFGFPYGAALTTSPSTYWLDHGPWSVTNPLDGSTSTERWESGAAVTGTSAGGLIIAPEYFHQFTVTFNVSPSNAGTTNPSGGTWENAFLDIPIAAAPNDGNSFVEWTSSGSITFAKPALPSTTMLVQSTGTVTATFTGGSGPAPVSASLVLGQTDFTSSGCRSASASTFCEPEGVAFDSSGNLWVADRHYNRILEYLAPLSTGEAAVHVLGEPDFSTNSCIGSTAASLCFPRGLAFDPSGNLWVVDSGDSRVLEYSQASLSTNGAAASLALGQTGLNFPNDLCDNSVLGSSASPTSSTLCSPVDLAFDSSGNLWVADGNNNRVLEYTYPFSTGEAAAKALGEPNFSTNTGCSIPITATALCYPYGLAFDSSGNLWVADRDNSRVLEYLAPLSTGEAAVHVLGEPDFSTNSANVSAAAILRAPTGLAFDSSGNLWVAGGGDNRVLEYSQASLSTNGAAASLVLGQTSFAIPSPCGASATSLCAPTGLAFDSSGNLWVGDLSNNRVLKFVPPFTTGMTTSAVGRPAGLHQQLG